MHMNDIQNHASIIIRIRTQPTSEHDPANNTQYPATSEHGPAEHISIHIHECMYYSHENSHHDYQVYY